MSNIDWGIVATIVVVVKGLWDIYKERHQPSLDLSSLDNNIAQAANISIKSLLEAMAQLQKEVDELKLANRGLRNDVQNMGQNIGRFRVIREKQNNIIARLVALLQVFQIRLEELGQETKEEAYKLDKIKEEISQIGTGPI